MEESIRHNAELVVKQMKDLLGVTLSYDEESVAWLDNYIVGIRGNSSGEVMAGWSIFWARFSVSASGGVSVANGDRSKADRPLYSTTGTPFSHSPK